MLKEKSKTVARPVGATSSRPHFEGMAKNNVGGAPLGDLNSRGITLIALIITIIVMLILVGVSVTVALNGGLFTTAKEAAEGTASKRNEELTLSEGKVQINGEWYDSMAEYVDGAGGNSGGENPEEGQVRLVIYDELDNVIYDEYISSPITIAEWYDSLEASEPIKDILSFGLVNSLGYRRNNEWHFLSAVGKISDEFVYDTTVVNKDTTLWSVPESVFLENYG